LDTAAQHAHGGERALNFFPPGGALFEDIGSRQVKAGEKCTPHIRAQYACAGKALGPHSHNREWVPIQDDSLSQNTRIRPILPLPECVTQHRHRITRSGIVLARSGRHATTLVSEGRIELLMKDARGEIATDKEGKPKTTPFSS
jgi:hypothetical protein